MALLLEKHSYTGKAQQSRPILIEEGDDLTYPPASRARHGDDHLIDLMPM
jgi:hypothetical protein